MPDSAPNNASPLPAPSQTLAEAFQDNHASTIAEEGLRHITSGAHCLLWYAEIEDDGESVWWSRIELANEQAAERFLPVERRAGQTYMEAWYEARLPEDKVRTREYGWRCIRSGHSYSQEFRCRRADGQVRWLAEDVHIELIGEKKWRAVGVCMDVTDSKTAHEQIEELNLRLRRAMAETHHRVKNNLQVISALIDMQALEHPEAVPTTELRRLGQHVRVLAALHDLLTQNARSHGDLDLLSLSDAMDKLFPLVKAMAGERLVRWEVDEAIVPVRQATALAVLINELVSNAVKHGEREIEVTITVDGSTAQLAVCDDGPGFPEGFNSHSAAHTGLELVESLSRWDLQGHTTYENRPEGGARVTVTFAVSQPPA